MSEHKHVNPWIVAIAVMFATFMEVLDTTVVNVSLPHIAGNLSATVEESTWVLTSYLVANAIILPMTGWLARNFGRKRLLMASVSGFTTASLLCGLAPNLSSLVVFRLIQGAIVGVDVPHFIFSPPPYLRQESSKIDYWGIGLLTVWVGCLQIALDLGQQRDWFSSAFITTLGVVFAVGLVAFIVRELMSSEPVIDL